MDKSNKSDFINKLILGDNLEVMKNMEDESVDLIYLDPPFFSNRNYEVIWGDKGEIRSFQDKWSGGVDKYILWLKERVEQMHRILKQTGSIFLHCDCHANAYIRVEILDKLFGMKNFKNEIIWCYTSASHSKSKLPNKHDTIYWYKKGETCTVDLDAIRIAYADKTSTNYKKGLKGSGTFYKGEIKSDEGVLNEKGKVPEDWWSDIAIAARYPKYSNNNLGYPTQKPEALLERIIKATSNEGDIVFDPFMGGGTTIAVADKLKRKWIGIDQSVQAIKVSELRLNKQQNMFSKSFVVQLQKYDWDELKAKDAFDFESWIVQQYGGYSNQKQRGDSGIDGKMPDNTPIQVKQSDDVGRNVVDNFLSAIQRYDKKLFNNNIKNKERVGILIAFSFGSGAVEEVSRLKNQENVIIDLVTVEKIIPISHKPTIKIGVKDLGKDDKGNTLIEFKATATSKVGIEFFAWDFNFDTDTNKFRPQILRDKDGEQKFEFQAGIHNIAVKVVDNDGLENVEVVKLKTNGKVKKY